MRTSFVRTVCMVAGLQAGAMAQSSWTQVASTGPVARENHSMAYDSQRGRTVLFGGATASSGPLGDTWVWDGIAWAQAASSGPPARTDTAMAFDSQRARVLLFGGFASGTLSDTWEWDGSTWLPQVFASGPAARYFHAMAFDSQRGRTVLFGGEIASGSNLADTWEWNGTTWTQALVNGPTARGGHAMSYDSNRGRTVLFGGDNGGNYLSDTWEWDGSGWLQRTTEPVGSAYHAMAYDSQRGRTVLFGGWNGSVLGATREWDGSSWTGATSGPTRFGHAMAYDGQRGRTVLFGGLSFSGPLLGDTWEWIDGSASAASIYGAGCGSPPLALSPVANARPSINTTAQASLANIPSSLAFVALGWSRTAFGPFPLPLTLAGFGMPGCDLLQSAEAPALPTTSTGVATATFSLALPNNSGMIGLHVYLQGWAIAPGVNPGNTIVSNGVDWGIGNS